MVSLTGQIAIHASMTLDFVATLAVKISQVWNQFQ